jgi:hypothetical protein
MHFVDVISLGLGIICESNGHMSVGDGHCLEHGYCSTGHRVFF